MTRTQQATVAIGALLVAALALWLLNSDDAPADSPTDATRPTMTSDGTAPAPTTAAPARPADTAAAAPVDLAPRAVPAPPTADTWLRVRLVGADSLLADEPALAFTLQALDPDEWRPTAAGERADVTATALDLAPLNPGAHAWTLSRGDVVFARGDLDIRTGGQELTLDLGSLPSLRGRVVDDEGRALEGAAIELLGSSPKRPPTSVVRTRSGAGGRFVIPGLPVGLVCFVSVSLEGRIPATVGPTHLVRPNGRDVGEIVLTRGLTLAGQVLGPDGVPLPDCPVVLRDGSAGGTTTSDEAGRYRFSGVSGPDALLWTEHDKLVDARHRVGDFADPTRADLQLSLGGWLSGTVHDEQGRPVSSMRLWGSPVHGGAGGEVDRSSSRRGFAVVGRDGAFRMGPFPAGTVELVDLTGRLPPTRLSTGEPATLIVPEPRDWHATVRVLDGRTGLPIARPGLYALRWESGGRGAQTFTPDASGAWSLEARNLPREPVDLVVRVEGYRPTVRAALDREVVGGLAVVELQPAGELVFEVADPAGRPVPDAEVTLVVRQDAFVVPGETAGFSSMTRGWFGGVTNLQRTVTTDAAGRAVFDVVAETPCHFAVVAAGREVVSGARPFEPALVPVTLHPWNPTLRTQLRKLPSNP